MSVAGGDVGEVGEGSPTKAACILLVRNKSCDEHPDLRMRNQ